MMREILKIQEKKGVLLFKKYLQQPKLLQEEYLGSR